MAAHVVVNTTNGDPNYTTSRDVTGLVPHPPATIRPVAAMPSIRGIRVSITTTSGW